MMMNKSKVVLLLFRKIYRSFAGSSSAMHTQSKPFPRRLKFIDLMLHEKSSSTRLYDGRIPWVAVVFLASAWVTLADKCHNFTQLQRGQLPPALGET